MKTLAKTAGLIALLSTSALAWADVPVAGRWDAQLERDGSVIPFRLDISGEGATLKGTLYDGFRPYEHTTHASYQDGKLVLDVGHYLTTISAELKDGRLVGGVTTEGRGRSTAYHFEATRHDPSSDAAIAATSAPSISGDWEIPLAEPSSKGEKAFRFIVEQKGAEVAASILRVDGDTGAHSGVYRDGKWRLSHFDGSRPSVIEVTPQPDGTLQILQQAARPQATEARQDAYASVFDSRNASRLVAYRPEVARAKGLPQPANHLTHTTPRDPNEKFTFSFPDLDGKLRTQDDADFKGKPIVAVVTGTWCPNCHDEAQYLVQLDKKYRAQGLRIVALNFEEVEQQASQQRARAFVKQYGVKYPYLLAGAPEEMWQKVPQLNNLNTWPATVFIGRDGTIRAVHSGFGSPSTGDFYRQQDKDFTSRVEQLLAEQAPPADAAAPRLSAAY
ncbi:MAG: TlpA disulfide reductase family protein [Pseudomonas sp.]